MAHLTIRNLEETIKTGLRQRAAIHGRSMEEEARQILKQAVQLKKPKKVSELLFTAVLPPLAGLSYHCLDGHQSANRLTFIIVTIHDFVGYQYCIGIHETSLRVTSFIV